MYKCAECGSEPVYKTADASTYDGPATEKIPVRCSNGRCENSDARVITSDSFVDL